MLTISKLAKHFGISRTTILYYEKEGLLLPKIRSENGYRWYGEEEQSRLSFIVNYRANGLPINAIKRLLEQGMSGSQFELLRSHFETLSAEICRLQIQQRAMISMMQEPEILKNNNVTKAMWVDIMIKSGFDEAGMQNWHRHYENVAPDKHLEFLRSLGIGEEEINKIRSL